MSLLWFTGTCLGVFTLLQFWFIPSLRKRVRQDPTDKVVARAARLVVYRYVRSVALVAAIIALIAALAVSLLRVEGSPRLTVQAVREATRGFDGLKQRLDAARPYWFAGAAAVLSSALGVYLYRRRAFQLNAALDALRSAEIDRQVNAMQNDPTWWSLPPSTVMVEIANRVNQLQESLGRQPEYLRKAYEAQIEELKRIYIQVNIMRRVNVKLDPDAIEDPAPETWREWLGGLLASPRVWREVGLGTRVLNWANLALLVLGLIGFQSHAVRQVIDNRLVELSDLEVNFTRLDELNRRAKELDRPKAENTTSTATSVETKLADISKQAERIEARRPDPTTDPPASPADEMARMREQVKARQAELRRQQDLIAEVRSRTAKPPRAPRRAAHHTDARAR